MTDTLYLADATDYSPADLAQVIQQQLAERYPASDNPRTAIMYSPKTMTAGQWVAACKASGFKPNTARNRFSEVRRWQKCDSPGQCARLFVTGSKSG
jgi:hypothetical protein